MKPSKLYINYHVNRGLAIGRSREESERVAVECWAKIMGGGK